MTDTIDYSDYKIMIVDSDNLYCQQLQSCLKDAGFQVDYERNAHAGLKRIKSWKPHIIVSDYVLHGMDYFAFAAKVEAMPMNASMVVVSSHYLDRQLITQLTNLSRVSMTLQKPIKPADLLNRIIQFMPTLERIQDEPEPSGSDDDDTVSDVDDEALQREVARLNFEGKDLPRFVNSLKALTKEAREQPHKSKFLREAVEQCKRITEEVRRQDLPHFEAPFERITNLLNEIIKEGSLPSLTQWDHVQDELESLGKPRKKVGTATLSVADIADDESSDTQEQLRVDPQSLPTSQWTPAVPPKAYSAHQPSMGVQKFLIIGGDQSEQLLNLGSRYGVSITIKDNLELAQKACSSELFDLVLLLIPATQSGERARETVVATHEMLRSIAQYKETPLVVLSAVESLHTRIVTAHLNNAHWTSWSAIRKSDAEFLSIRALAAQRTMRPEVLIVDSDISDSEDLLRELSRRCSKVDALHDPNLVIKVIEENRPDIVLISEQSGDLSGFDLCRAIRSCLSFKSATLIMKVNSINERALKGAFRAGADGVICKTESIESRAEIMLTIYQRNVMSRIFSQEAQDKPLEVTAEIRQALENNLKRAVEEQLPLTICLIDLSEESLPTDYFSHLWNSKHKQLAPDSTSTVHFLSSTQVLLSVVGLRKSIVAKALEDMIEPDQMEDDYSALPWNFRCRCYPDDALTLPELLRFF